ncbi:MAG: hypothetical protein Kow00122_17520 [Thermoleophilia bacterium]
MRFLEGVSARLTTVLAAVAGVTLVGMMLLTVANMVLRQVAVPFGATAEVVGWLSALTTALALSYSQVKKAHIAIEMVTDRLPPGARAALVGVMRLVSLALFVLMTWQLAGYATNIRRLGTLSETLRISYYPLVYLVALGVAAFCLRLLVETLSGFRGRRPA